MKDEDYLTLDGRSLQIFLTVLEQGSVTTALWHKRHERDPTHQWLRLQMEEAANQLVQRLKSVK